MTFRPATTAILQNAATATGDGNTLSVDGCAAVSFQVSGTFTATVTFEGTVNGANWVAIQAFPSTGSTGTTTATAAGVWIASCAGLRQVRARVTWTGGTSITVLAAAIPGSATAITGGAAVTATTSGDVAHDSPDSGNPIKVGGKAESTSPAAVADGDRVDAWFDLLGRQVVMPAYTRSAVAVADVQIKGSPGVLHSVTISCNDAAPTAGSLIIYDSLTETGTQVFNHTFTTTPFVPFTVTLDYIMTTGIYAGFTTTGDVNVSMAYA